MNMMRSRPLGQWTNDLTTFCAVCCKEIEGEIWIKGLAQEYGRCPDGQRTLLEVPTASRTHRRRQCSNTGEEQLRLFEE